MEKDFLKKLGKRIREIRLKRALRQEDVAFRADMERSHYSRLELGQSNPTSLTLRKVAIALEVEVKDLFEF